MGKLIVMPSKVRTKEEWDKILAPLPGQILVRCTLCGHPAHPSKCPCGC